jgi:chromosome segregation ATPase
MTAQIQGSTQAGDEIVAPDWTKKIEAIIAAGAGLKESFNQSRAFYQEWRTNLTTPPEELILRVKQRRELIKCINAHFDNKDKYIKELNILIAQLDKSIDELTSHIAFLELEIAGKNENIQQLKEEIKTVHASYKELIGEDEEKAELLMNTIRSLLMDYQDTVREREMFRTNLEEYYKILHEYNADIRVDWNKLEKSICKKEESTKSKDTKEDDLEIIVS